MPFLQQTSLVRLRRYQRLLAYGAGSAITVLILLAWQLGVLSLVRASLVGQQQDFIVDQRLVMNEIQVREASLRDAVVSAELVWQQRPGIDDAALAQFYANGGELTIQPSHGLAPLFAFVTGHPDTTDSELRRYLGAVARLAHARPASAMLRGDPLAAYYYSTRRNFAALMPAPENLDIGRRAVLSDRDALVAAADAMLPLASLPASAPASDTGDAPARPKATRHSDAAAPRWLPPSASPLTGQTSVRLAAAAVEGEDPFAVLVAEYAPQALLQTVKVNSSSGAFLIVAGDGQLVASFSPGQADGAFVERVLRTADPSSGEHTLRPVFQRGKPGFFTISDTLGATGWTLVYGFSWYDVLASVAVQLVVVSVAAAVTIAALWIVLLLFNRRVFRPVYEQSQRVFDSEQLSRTLIEMAPVGLGLIAREDARPLLSSPMMEAMAGRAQLGGATLPEELVRAHGGGASHVELSVETAEGLPVDLSVNMAPARYQGRAVLVTAFTDVTARKQLERQLREARQAADAANAAKSTFLATMSHEIRTPLNAMLGNLELLGYTDLNARQQDRLATIRQSSQGLLSVISDVLDFSKIEAGEMTLERIEFGLAEVLERTLAMFAPVARARGLALYAVMRCAPGQTVTGDPTRLAQILNNLMGNAIKFTQFGKVMLETALVEGELVVSVEDTGIGLTPAQQAGLFQAFAQADSTISRRFGGTGLGLALCQRLAEAMGGTISAESRYSAGSRFTLRFPAGQTAVAPVRLFERERRPVIFVSREAEWREAVVPHLRGWGLDVRVMASAAEVDAGELRQACGVVLYGEGATGDEAQPENHLVEAGLWVITGSAEGPWEPARFGRLIDVTAYSVSALERALRMALLGEGAKRGVQAGAHAVSRKLAVLVAEDNAVNRQLFEEQLALLGCEALVIGGGAEALAALESQHWDVVLTDLNMPGMSGYELVARIRARDASIPVVAVTAQATLEERQRCEAAGMTRMVTKPLSLASLREMLEQVSGDDASDAYDDERADETAEDLLGVGQALPAHLLETFREASEASLAVIAQAHAKSDAAPLLAELHTLKGMLGVFRARELAHYCAHLEQQIATQGVKAVTPADLAALATEVQKLAHDDEVLC